MGNRPLNRANVNDPLNTNIYIHDHTAQGGEQNKDTVAFAIKLNS